VPQLIEQQYARSAHYARLAPAKEGFRWTLDSEADELDVALRPLVEWAVSLMTSPRMARLRRCGNAACYWLYIDETKNASRRWCEMASLRQPDESAPAPEASSRRLGNGLDRRGAPLPATA
jgi:predicted RNA-binding Zn ribbon-like protein